MSAWSSGDVQGGALARQDWSAAALVDLDGLEAARCALGQQDEFVADPGLA